MRELSEYTLLISIVLLTIFTLILFFYIERFSKVNHDDTICDTTRDTQLEYYSNIINRYIFISKLLFILLVIVIFDTTFIYERSLLDHFNNNKELICKTNSMEDAVEISNTTHTYINDKYLFIQSGQIYKNSNLSNAVVELKFCEIKNKRWYQ